MRLNTTTTTPAQRLAHRLERRVAFTLVEMMIVVAIIVSLAGLGVFYMAGQIDESYKSKARADIKSITDAATVYKTQHSGQWPQALEVLVQPKDQEGFGPYLKSPEDLISPWGTPYQYDQNGTNNSGTQPDVWVDIPGGAGRIGNWTRKLIH